MKIFIIVIIFMVAGIFLYVKSNTIESIKQRINDSERCARFNKQDEENKIPDYSIAIRKLLNGCF